MVITPEVTRSCCGQPTAGNSEDATFDHCSSVLLHFSAMAEAAVRHQDTAGCSILALVWTEFVRCLIVAPWKQCAPVVQQTRARPGSCSLRMTQNATRLFRPFWGAVPLSICTCARVSEYSPSALCQTVGMVENTSALSWSITAMLYCRSLRGVV
jgi:hypothetical protein